MRLYFQTRFIQTRSNPSLALPMIILAKFMFERFFASRLMTVIYGLGAALILDEFAPLAQSEGRLLRREGRSGIR